MELNLNLTLEAYFRAVGIQRTWPSSRERWGREKEWEGMKGFWLLAS